MQEFTTPSLVEVDPTENLTTLVWEHERTHPTRAALAYRQGDAFVDVSTAEFAARIRRLAAGFIGLGIEPGSRICLFSPTRLEFTLFDYAIWAAGCATVTIYETSAASQVAWIVENSAAVAIVCATDALLEVYEEQAGRLGTCAHALSLESGGLEQLLAAGEAVSDHDVMARAKAVMQDDLATLVYTSGTTGRPKGCVITHRHFVHSLHQVLAALPDVLKPNETTLMFLPLAHIFARIVQVGCVVKGMRIAYSTGIPHLTEELAMTRPWFVFAVPRVFEKIFNSARQRAEDAGKTTLFDLAASTAIGYSRERQAGRVSLKTKALHSLFDKLVYGKLRAVFGGNLRYAVSGGAALGERLGHFFSGLGLTVLEGYGLTETTSILTCNTPEHIEIGTVGRPAPGFTVRIAADGEVLAQGPGIFQGYWKHPEATAEALDTNGWFHTGDVGTLDDRGFLRLTGRKKELIVTAGGKNIAPLALEDTIRAHPLISQAVVVGDGRPFVGALVTIDPEFFEGWAKQHGKIGALADLVDDPDLRRNIQEAIDAANASVSRAESIREFRILPVDFTIEGGELTPTLKVKRQIVSERFADTIASIYGA
jgi:long-chain acyl-CoA synthetase